MDVKQSLEILKQATNYREDGGCQSGNWALGTDGIEAIKVAIDVLKKTEILKKAFDIACEESADSSCPKEFDLYECEKCMDCPHQNEMHEDTQRDINCWKQYYLQKAQKSS